MKNMTITKLTPAHLLAASYRPFLDNSAAVCKLSWTEAQNSKLTELGTGLT